MTDGQGDELCDLLVVCGDNVIVFSDKTIGWQQERETSLAWRRWYKRAVGHSVRQINGAIRWITNYPDRIFLDKKCTAPLPIKLPAPERMKLHGVVVARGAGDACRKHFDGGIGSLLILPGIEGDKHYKGDSVVPFSIGDVNPGGPFIHVLDDGSLDIVMRELDTVADFTDYLTKKEILIRSSGLTAAGGEEDLVAYYMTHMESKYEHGFPRPDGKPFRSDDSIAIEGVYSALTSNPQYIAKKQADDVSYLWDNLIKAFTDPLLAGTTLVGDDEVLDLEVHGLGVRYMALAPRFHRRQYGEGIKGALERSDQQHRFTRAFIAAPHTPEPETGFFFMTLAVPDFELDGGYDQYRNVRRAMLETYAESFLYRHQYLKRIVGIATEPIIWDASKRKGSSEDMILAEPPPEWTDEYLKELQSRQQHFDIMHEGRYKEYPMAGQEWPDVQSNTPTVKMGRKQHRAQAAKRRKKPKKPKNR